MARKPTIDVAMAIQMLRDGQSTQAVAEHFGVSRQAIDLHRRKLIQSGQLVDKRANRTTETVPTETVRRQSPSVKRPADVSLDGVIDLAIQAFGSLKRVPQIEAELARCKQDYDQARLRIDELELELRKRTEQEARWKLAMTGDANLPLNDPQHSPESRHEA